MNGEIVVLHTEASDGWGGQEIRILDEMMGIRGRGYRVILATPSHSMISGRAANAGIEVFPLKMGKASLVLDVFRLAGIIRNNRVSIINTHSSRDSWIGSLAGLITGRPVIRSRHISSRLRPDPLTRLVYNRLSDAVITTGEFVREQLIKDVGVRRDKLFSIPTGVDAARYMRADGGKIRRSLGIGRDETVLGVAAVLRSWKGHDYLLKAMPEILAEFPKVRLLLAGEGPRRRAIEGLVRELGLSEKVTLLGHRNDVAPVIAAFDISLLVSYASEGVPQFLLQSMAAGKPVIGARTGGIPEVVQDGVNGIVVEPRDPAAIAGAVRRMLSDPAGMSRMGEAGREIVRKRYSREGMLDEIEALYKRLLG